MLDRIQIRFFIARSVTLAGLSFSIAVYANISPANSQCRERQDQRAAIQSDPRYSALQQAVDTYFTERQKVEGFSGVSVHISGIMAQPPPNPDITVLHEYPVFCSKRHQADVGRRCPRPSPEIRSEPYARLPLSRLQNRQPSTAIPRTMGFMEHCPSGLLLGSRHVAAATCS